MALNFEKFCLKVFLGILRWIGGRKEYSMEVGTICVKRLHWAGNPYNSGF